MTNAAPEAVTPDFAPLNVVADSTPLTPTPIATVTEDDKIWLAPNGWYAHNNIWNRRELVNGVDYTSTITITDDSDAFPAGMTFEWNFPEVANDAFVYGYPEVTIGQKPWIALLTTFDNFPIEVSNLVNLDLNFDIDWTIPPTDADFFIAVSL